MLYYLVDIFVVKTLFVFVVCYSNVVANFYQTLISNEQLG